jgi:DNA polymerase I-like protein with 3'-5' exonuclease and polymerase domains
VQCELRIMAHFSQDATLISLLQVNIRKLNTSN